MSPATVVVCSFVLIVYLFLPLVPSPHNDGITYTGHLEAGHRLPITRIVGGMPRGIPEQYEGHLIGTQPPIRHAPTGITTPTLVRVFGSRFLISIQGIRNALHGGTREAFVLQGLLLSQKAAVTLIAIVHEQGIAPLARFALSPAFQFINVHQGVNAPVRWIAGLLDL